MTKVAATYEKETGNVFQHFGKSQNFKIYEIEDNKIVKSEVIDNGGFGHHDLATYLKNLGVETLILGNRGQGAIDALNAAGLKQVPGITGSADQAAEKFAKGTLVGNPNAKCDHHGEHHHEEHHLPKIKLQ
ncbi:MAG: NifB/NifX family molybdenum-iron cluster-binding protein [Treponemataceae bacterium]|nr:NifB/NifX family molybdenum-iron cluster-binding protein [Treponemataceae bacterium]